LRSSGTAEHPWDFARLWCCGSQKTVHMCLNEENT
jgi:hypothetical protein